MKVVLFGNNERGCVVLEALASEHDVLSVFCLPDNVQPEWSRNIREVADDLDIHVVIPAAKEVGGPLLCKPDVIVLAGWPRLIHESLYNEYLCLNLHAGPLPRYRGRAPINWQIINGEEQIGISIAQVDSGIDTGPIYAQKYLLWNQTDTYTTILKKVLDVYPSLLLSVLDGIENNRVPLGTPVPQKRTDGFFCTARFPSDGRIDWSRPSKDVHNLIRALTYPMPNAFTYYQYRTRAGPMHESMITISKSQIIETTYRGVPGRIAAHWPSGVVVCCGDSGLLIRAWNGPMPETGETLC